MLKGDLSLSFTEDVRRLPVGRPSIAQRKVAKKLCSFNLNWEMKRNLLLKQNTICSK
jgi:hypothetical protein